MALVVVASVEEASDVRLLGTAAAVRRSLGCTPSTGAIACLAPCLLPCPDGLASLLEPEAARAWTSDLFALDILGTVCWPDASVRVLHVFGHPDAVESLRESNPLTPADLTLVA